MSAAERDEPKPADNTTYDPARADTQYVPFPPVSTWIETSFDQSHWDSHSQNLQELRTKYRELEPRALMIVRRAAAIETGAIEGLYDLERGFTFTVATEAAMWEAAFQAKGEKVRAMFEAHLNAYESVVDFATRTVPVAEAWIRGLHAEVCAAQDVYSVVTALGPQEQVLPKGEYKQHPNHVILRDGRLHAYAPVSKTAQEVQRLVDELQSDAFQNAHPVLQASYSHYAFAAIHPFADGNGRVARALASVYTCRAKSVPLLILVEHRGLYFQALEAADRGEFNEFVQFIGDRAVDAMRLFEESLTTARAADPEATLARLKALYRSNRGYTHSELDEAGAVLLNEFHTALSSRIAKLELPENVSLSVQREAGVGPPTQSGNRVSKDGKAFRVRLTAQSAPPAGGLVEALFHVEVPAKEQEFDLAIVGVQWDDGITARMTELIPEGRTAISMRLQLTAERIVGNVLSNLFQHANASLGNWLKG
jgi:Fic family protein